MTFSDRADLSDVRTKINRAIDRVVDVRNHGAAVDGATDDLAGFTAAIAELPTYGGVVYVHAGDYAISAALQSGANQGVCFCGPSPSQISRAVLKFTQDTGGIQFTQAQGYVGGLFLQKTVEDTGGVGIHMDSNAKWFKIEDVKIDGFSVGVRSNDSVMSVMSKVTAQDCDTGFKFDSRGTSFCAYACWALQTSENSGSIGFDIDKLKYSDFTACGADAISDTGFRLANVSSINLGACATEGSATDHPNQALLIDYNSYNVGVQNFYAHSSQNSGQGAACIVRDSIGETKFISIDGFTNSAPNASGEDDFEIDCTGPVYIRNARRIVSDVEEVPTFSEIVGLHEYFANWTAAITMSTSGTVTLSTALMRLYRRGRIINLTGRLIVGSVSSPAGTAQLSLPFACGSSLGSINTVGTVLTRNATFSGHLALSLNNGASSALFREIVSGSDWGSFQPAAGDEFWISLQYETDDGYTRPSGVTITSPTLNE